MNDQLARSARDRVYENFMNRLEAKLEAGTVTKDEFNRCIGNQVDNCLRKAGAVQFALDIC